MDIKSISVLVKSLTQQFLNREYADHSKDTIILWVLILETHQNLSEIGIETDSVIHIIRDFRRAPEHDTILGLFSSLPDNHPIYQSLISQAGAFILEWDV